MSNEKKTFEEMTPEEKDAIIKPKHHTQALPNGIEFMDYMKHWLPRFKDPVYAGGLMQTMKYLTDIIHNSLHLVIPTLKCPIKGICNIQQPD